MIFSKSLDTVLCKYLIFKAFIFGMKLAYKENKRSIQRGRDMQWVEIIALRSAGNINRELLDELLEGVEVETDTLKHLVEIKLYHHSAVETDLSIHIYWKSESGSQDKSPLGLALISKYNLFRQEIQYPTYSLSLHGTVNVSY